MLVRIDNHTVMAYINRQEGVQSAAFLSMAGDLWRWASVVPEGVPRV